MTIARIFGELLQSHALTLIAAVGGFWFLFFFKRIFFSGQNKIPNYLPPVPAIPGLPFIGNLLHLKEKKPYKTFTMWAETYGPIYSVKLGTSIVIVISSATVAKEAMVTRFSSISTRKLSKALKILTFDKSMVAMSDYDDFHKFVKRCILTSVLGANAQKGFLHNRETMMENISNHLHSFVNKSPLQSLNFRKIFESELFRLAMMQTLGRDIKSIYVEDIRATLSRDEIFDVLVTDPMEGAIEVDWRDFFPYLWWIPNKRMEEKIHRMDLRRSAIMRSLIKQHKEEIMSQEKMNCYLDFLLSESKTLSNEQIAILTWEAIIETSDTTLVTTEWALYELARDPIRQDHLYQEIKQVCGSNKITEEQLSQLPYLTCVFHETLRKYSPAPVIPLRYVHEDTQLGGFFIPAGTQIAMNIYGCNMEKKKWENPEDWKPERFLDKKYEDSSDLYKTMAFGAGKRACAGSLQAMLIFCTAIGRVIQEFECTLGDGEEGNVNTIGLTSRKLLPLFVMFKPR